MKDWEREREWLAGLKPGDEVVQHSGGWSNGELAPVARVTATQIIVGTGHGEKRYRRGDGHEVGTGGRYTRGSIHEPTQEARDLIRRDNLVARLRGVDWRKLHLAALDAVAAALDANPAPRVSRCLNPSPWIAGEHESSCMNGGPGPAGMGTTRCLGGDWCAVW